MDSYSFHFERMSNLDLYPLGLPGSRLSPAKSTSSIDQYTHQHGKGDSAYSSFSGGSCAPDYPSPFLSDDFHPHSLHYADLKYVKAVYGSSVLNSDSKSPIQDQLYRSMEAIAHHQQHQNNNGCHLIQDPPASSAPLTTPPPPPPVRLDSFITTRNLETSRARQSPEGQLADISSFRTQTTNPKTFGPRPDPVFGYRVSQHYQRDQLKQDLADKIPESKSETVLSRLPQQTSQPEHSQQMKCSQSEIQKKRLHSAYGGSVTEQQRALSSWHMAQNTISGSIQHKGQFYFVTGVYKSPESSVPQAQCVVERSSTEPHRQAEQQRSHSTMESMFKNVDGRKPSSPDGANGKLFFQEEKKSCTPNEETESPSSNLVFNNFFKTEKASQNVDDLEDAQSFLSVDVGRQHTANHPIFYCGPEKSFPTLDTSQNRAVIEKNQKGHAKTDEPVTRLTRHLLADVPTDKISKETTPLLYHLTGASQVSLINKVKNDKNSRFGSKESFSGDSPHSDVSKEEKLKDKEFFYPCNTLDDSFKKYYKEKLKDAQSKVLRETSFKRKDLQLSWPNRIEQWSDKRLSVTPLAPSSQDMHLKLESPIQHHLPGFQETDQNSLKNPSQVIEKQIEKDTAKPQNVPQPQVARIGSRRRLTRSQKKLSHSEPEKLHQLADRPIHMTCRSLGSESEVLLSEENPGEHGLVATRRKMFETRGRALSTSSLSKSTLKHLQQKALVAYMERKTGHKAAEPQQPAPQVPSQRHSTAGRQPDWGPRPHSASAGSKKKLLRPLSAGRILDSSSARSAQSISAQSSVQSQQSSWKEGLPSPPLCASVENLLDEREKPFSFRTCGTSAASAFHQIHRHFEPSALYDQDISSSQISVEGEVPVSKHYGGSVPDQRRMRVMAPRGKSLEELGVSKVISPRVLSKSSEQLHQLPDKHVVSDRDKRGSWFLKHEHTQRKVKQDCVVLVGSEKNAQVAPGHRLSKEPCSGQSPSTVFHSRTRSCGSYPASTGLEISAQVNYVPSCADKPQMMLYGDDCIAREDKGLSPASSPRGASENNLGVSKMKAVPQEQSVMKAEESAGDVSEEMRYNLGNEVSLSLGVTTEPSLWNLPPEIDDSNAGEVSEHAATGHPQSTPLTSSAEMETTPNPSDLDTESSPVDDGDQEKQEKEMKCGPLVAEKLEEDGPKDQTWWETMVHVVVSADQSLARILYPVTNRKTALMLMEQLLSEDTLLMEEHYKKKQEQKIDTPDPTSHSSEMTNADIVNNSLTPKEDGISLTAQQQHGPGSIGGEITEKKRQMIACIEKQLKSLEGLRSSLQEEEREIAAQGAAMEALVSACCVPSELERYTQFIGDLERVINLLLVLSARLARVQNALSTVDENTDAEEKQSLDNRHHLLCKQRDDAKDLKDNLDRRERMVSTFLAKQLTDAQLQEYRRFVQTKASLLIRQKDLDEKQRLGEEQLEALLNSIPP
ncbi:protein Shroom1 [Salminus brasiliensis]|uniref:protein Shroom1 n=1 Tax=Salminus brasiliensis TaxID=930266 RepID=UPI003B82F815